MSPATLHDTTSTSRADLDALEAAWAAPAYEPRRNIAPLHVADVPREGFDAAYAAAIVLFAALVAGGVVLALTALLD